MLSWTGTLKSDCEWLWHFSVPPAVCLKCPPCFWTTATCQKNPLSVWRGDVLCNACPNLKSLFVSYRSVGELLFSLDGQSKPLHTASAARVSSSLLTHRGCFYSRQRVQQRRWWVIKNSTFLDLCKDSDIEKRDAYSSHTMFSNFLCRNSQGIIESEDRRKMMMLVAAGRWWYDTEPL